MDDLIPELHRFLPGMIFMSLLILGSAFFSASETALFYLTHDQLRRYRNGGRRERTVAALMSDPDRLLSAVLFWNLLINLAYFAVSLVMSVKLTRSQHEFLAGGFGIMSLAGIILFGEVIPKSFAVSFSRQVARSFSLPLVVAIAVLDPVLPRLNTLTRVLRRAFWPQLPAEPHLDARDLETAVENSLRENEIGQRETDVLHNILDLSEIPVEEVMRPRVTYRSFSPPVRLANVENEIPRLDYLMIAEPTSDNIGGVVRLGTEVDLPLQNIEDKSEDVIHVPWCSSVALTLQLLRESFRSVAVVINEYGETIGIITYEDIVDTILTAQASRTKRVLKREPVLEVAPGRYHVDGLTTLRYLSKRLGIPYELDPDMHLTVAGLFQEHLQHLPDVGDECRWRHCLLRVIDVVDRSNLRVMLSVDSKADQSDSRSSDEPSGQTPEI